MLRIHDKAGSLQSDTRVLLVEDAEMVKSEHYGIFALWA